MKIAVAQIDPKIGERSHNLEICLNWLHEAAAQGCSLLVLPECANSGYVFGSAEEAVASAEPVPGLFVEALERACARLGLYCVSGVLERERDSLCNTAVLVGPNGLIGRYRKSHLPYLGVDRFVSAGDELSVFDTPIGCIGLEICYDLRFPEVTRTLALKGADVVALPTNWPVASRDNADILTRARAYENHVFLLVANRVGVERGTEFCGWSQICSPNGERLAEAGSQDKTLLVAEIELKEARTKEKEILPESGTYEVSLFGHRRPKLYRVLAEDRAVVSERCEEDRWLTS